jgi:uncharacterized protein (TIRG00374 family)
VRLKPIWILIIVGVIAVYGAIAIGADRAALVSGLGVLGVSGAVFIVALTLINFLLRFWRWDWYLRDQVRIPVRQHLLYYIAGFALTATPGKAGEALRSMYLHHHGVRYSQSIALLFVERLLDMAAILALAAPIMFATQEYRLAAILSVVLIFGGMILVTTGAMGTASRWFGRRGSERWRKFCGHTGDMFDRSRTILSLGRMFAGMLIGLVAWAAQGYGLYLLADALGIQISMLDAIAINSTATLVGALMFFLPGGVGGAEVVMTLLLVSAGSPLGVAVIATVIIRFATLWLAVILGLLAVLILNRTPLPARAPEAT